MLGFSSPTLTSLVVAGTNFVFTVAALLLVDRIGKKANSCCTSIPFMVAGLLLAAYGFSFIDLPANSAGALPSAQSGRGAASLILISIMIYVAGYAVGLGDVPWMQSERSLCLWSVRSPRDGPSHSD